VEATKIDRLALSFRDDHRGVTRFLTGLYGHVGTPAFEPTHGRHAFRYATNVRIGGALLAWLAWGGVTQRGRSYVDVTGLGCQLVRDWREAQDAAQALPGVKIKRVDIAADFFHGEVSYSDVLAAHEGGKFRRGVRPPKLTQILGSDGRTAYIGARGGDVMCRCYEKGLKEGSSFDRWFRVELELRAVKRPLGFDVIADRDQYFAGAYPFLQEVMPDIEPRVLVTPERVAESNLAKSLGLIREQWGTTLFTALTVLGGDACELVSRIVGSHHNQRLLNAGALLFADAPSTDQAGGHLTTALH
jgi:phage replication initiation protein